MNHKINTPAAVRYSALFPAFEADAMIAMIEHEPVGCPARPEPHSIDTLRALQEG